MDTDQTAPVGSTLFDQEASKTYQQMTKQAYFVVNGTLRANSSFILQHKSLAMRKPVYTQGIQQLLRSDCSFIHTMNPY